MTAQSVPARRPAAPRGASGPTRAALTLGALGVVFGDIGTSPLYAMQTIFSGRGAHTVPVSHEAVYGVVSLVFWTIMVIVTITYVLLVMRADNDGEGGLMALIALLQQTTRGAARSRLVAVLSALGIVGVSLFLGDSTITPAISVLSAVEGLGVVDASLTHLVVPITAAILIGLFTIQHLGTSVVGRLFGPVMIVWFAVIAGLGLREIVAHPAIMRGLSPSYAVAFFAHQPGTAFLSLAAVVLTVTGAEALYADLGHFGRGAIRRAWALVVLPALVLTYFGQAALVLHDRAAATNPFFLLVPEGARLPMVVLATAATIIASQAVISGTFSVALQAIQLGYLPRLRVVHTSAKEIGQVYVPWINWLLLAAVLVLVFAFQSSARLAAAYGVAVTGTIAITTLLFFALSRLRSGWPLWLSVGGAVTLGFVDLAFLTANLPKIMHGGWLPLLVGAMSYVVLSTWRTGRHIVAGRRTQAEGPLPAFLEQVEQPGQRPMRVPGTAVFLHATPDTTPLAMRANVERNGTLHENLIVVAIKTVPRPRVPADERVSISELSSDSHRVARVTVRFGFHERPHIPEALRAAVAAGLPCPLDVDRVPYVLSTIDLVLSDRPGMARWRKRIFLATAHLGSDPVEYFALPRERVLLIGSVIEV
jgi:KUP system potassium uptake protein